jgi:hypothetical protein
LTEDTKPSPGTAGGLLIIYREARWMPKLKAFLEKELHVVDGFRTLGRPEYVNVSRRLGHLLAALCKITVLILAFNSIGMLIVVNENN